MKIKEKFIVTKFRVNDSGFCDDKNPESIVIYSNYTLKRLKEIAKQELRINKKVYAIEIKTIKTGMVHVVV